MDYSSWVAKEWYPWECHSFRGKIISTSSMKPQSIWNPFVLSPLMFKYPKAGAILCLLAFAGRADIILLTITPKAQRGAALRHQIHYNLC